MGMMYESFSQIMETVRGRKCPQESGRPVVCVQGLGFVGSAMAAGVSNAVDANGNAWFDVIGVDLDNHVGLKRIKHLNMGEFPFETSDTKLTAAVRRAVERRNFVAVSDPAVFSLASVTVVDVHLDIDFTGPEPEMHLDGFLAAIRTLGEFMRPGALVLVETTVPPGTCEKIVVPELAKALKRRSLDPGSLLVAHSYERVMPGPEYYDSIVNFWRVYAGHTMEAADACESFLAKVINVREFPMTRLGSTTASETGKVLENSYRAANIAFMDEWGRFAEAIGIDLFEVISAIKVRPTHNNIRQPGFGVGGYCLTKDPLFAPLAARNLFGLNSLSFPFCTQSVRINRQMPMRAVDYLCRLLGGSLGGKRILLCGVSYRSEIADTRNSPSQTFVETARAMGASVICQDPLVRFWEELGEVVLQDVPSPLDIDAIVFAVSHKEYESLDFGNLIGCNDKMVVLDANNVLTKRQLAELKALGLTTAGIGRGEWK